MGRFWSSRIPFKSKRMLFLAKVWSAATSCLEVMCWTRRDLRGFDGLIAKLGRRMLRRWGNQVDEGEDGTRYKAMR